MRLEDSIGRPMNNNQIFQKLDRTKNLPTLPTIALKVNEMLKDYDVSVDELTKVLETDQAIVTKLLKLVNSAFYGFKSKIKNIPHAVTLMGFNTLRNAVVSVSIIDAFKIQNDVEGFDINAFWSHSIEVAVVAKYLSSATRLHPPEEMFTLGLLHDIGKLVQLIALPDLFKQILSTSTNENLSFHEAEKKLALMSHARIGAYVANKWNMPEDVVDVLKYHHHIKAGVPNYKQIVIVHIADLIVNATGGGACVVSQLQTLESEIKNRLLSTLKNMSDWFPKAKVEIETACQFFMEE